MTERNPWHEPAGSPIGGRFAHGGWVDSARLAAGLPSELERDYPDLFDALGKNLLVEDINSIVVQRHLRDMQRIPVAALRELKQYGVKIYIANKSVSEFPGMEGMANIRPPGWGEGATFKDLAGFYNNSGKVYLGAGNWDIPSLAIHEISHAMDEVKQVSESPEMQKFYEEYQKIKGAYHTDRNSANAISEFFAGSATEIFMGVGKVYKKDYVDFVYGVFGGKSD